LATSIRYKHRRRGTFGWLFLLAFWLFNGLMLLLVVAGWSKVDGGLSLEPLGLHIGAVIPVFLWVVGGAVLGRLAYATRGRYVVVISDDRGS
jgi:hypothetical protein